MLDIPWKSWKCVEIKIVQLYQDQSKVFCESFISSKFQIFSLIKIDSVCQSVCPASQPCKVGVTSRDVLVHNYERKSYLLISGNIKNKGSGFRKKNIRAKIHMKNWLFGDFFTRPFVTEPNSKDRFPICFFSFRVLVVQINLNTLYLFFCCLFGILSIWMKMCMSTLYVVTTVTQKT